MYMIYDVDGDPVSYQETEPSSGTYTLIPASAMQDPPLCFWNTATKSWQDGDGGYRWNAGTQQFDYALGNLFLKYEHQLREGRDNCIKGWYEDYATVLFNEHMGVEARAYASDPAPNLANYPIIDQLKTAMGLSQAVAAEEIRSKYLLFHAQIGAIWATWRAKWTALDSATSIAEMDAIMAFDWIEDVIVPATDLTDFPTPWLATPVFKATAQVDFGATETSYAEVLVPATWASATRAITPAFAVPTTADHDPEDALIEQLSASVVAIDPGVSFTIGVHAPEGTWGRYDLTCTGV